VKATGRELKPRPVNRKFNALPLIHHATQMYAFVAVVKAGKMTKFKISLDINRKTHEHTALDLHT